MFRNMKIGKKLVFAFIFVTAICSISGFVGLGVLENMNANYGSALVNYGFAQGEIGLFNAEFKDNSATIRDLIYSTDVREKKSYSNQISQSNEKINTYFANMQKSMTGAKEQGYYKDMKDALEKYAVTRDQIVDLALKNRNEEAQNVLSKQATPLSNKIQTDINALIAEKTGSGKQLSNTLSSQAFFASFMILAVISAAVLLSLFTALAVSRGISRPIQTIANAARNMAKGDLNGSVSVYSRDEVGQLGAAFSESAATIRTYITDITRILGELEHGNLNVSLDLEYIGDYAALKESLQSILNSLNHTMKQITASANQVSGSSEQISGGAQILAQGAAEQASSVEELAATIADISEHVKNNAAHAQEANRNVNRAQSEIQVSSRCMNAVTESMAQISDSSSQIGKITKTVEDIAFRTNILALNAAVEAARAGAAGKGFAVVANEVRSLAGKCAQSAKDTGVLIAKCMEQVENGTKVADEAAISLRRVVESAEAVTETVQKISEASARQSEAIAQVTLGVEQISGVVQTNSATAQESAAASEEMSAQAQALNGLVSRFTLFESLT